MPRRTCSVTPWRVSPEKKALVDRYNEIAANYSEETADEMAELQDQIDAQGLWDLDTQVEQALDACVLHPVTPRSASFPVARSAASH